MIGMYVVFICIFEIKIVLMILVLGICWIIFFYYNLFVIIFLKEMYDWKYFVECDIKY